MLTVKAPQRKSDTYAAPVQNSTVRLTVFNPAYDETGYLPMHTFSFIPLEPITFSVSTSWKDGAAASVAGKINELMSNKFVRMVSGPELFTPVATDAWSQQVVEKGEPISIKLKFRSYYNETNDPTGFRACDARYLDVIRFFAFCTAPYKKYSLSTATLGVVANAARSAVKTGEAIGTAVKGRPEDTSFVGAAAAYTVAAVGDVAGMTLESDGNKTQRGGFTLLVNTRNYGCGNLDWIVKSVSIQPSQQFVAGSAETNEKIKDVPMPLWVDFDVELETNMSPSNALVSRFFTKKTIK